MWEEILRSPWFYSSPSPMSLLFHAIVILLVARVLRKRICYKKRAWLISLTDAFFLVGFIVLSGDFMWMVFCAIRFLPSYPDNWFLVATVLGRNAVGMLFCYLSQSLNFKNKIIRFTGFTYLVYFQIGLFFAFNFFLIAETPAWTDWTYAIRQGYDIDFILKSFAVTWVGGKILSALLVYSWFKS